MEKRTHGLLFTLVVAVSIVGLLLYAAVAGALNIRGTQAFAADPDKTVEVGGSSTYATVSEALTGESSVANLAIKLIGDADIADNIIIPSGKTVTIDLNDHVLKAGAGKPYTQGVLDLSVNSVIYVESGATLTVKDTAEESSKTTRYFTDEKCSHGVAVGQPCADCGVCGHGKAKGNYCSNCRDYSLGNIDPIAKQDGCYETLSTENPGGEEGSGYLAIKGGIITGGTGSGTGSTNKGGGIYTLGSLTLENVNVVGNRTTGDGGGVYASIGAKVSVTGGFICGNYANYGGALYNSCKGDDFVVQGATISWNRSKSAVYLDSSGGTIKDAIITANQSFSSVFDPYSTAGVFVQRGITLGGNTFIYDNIQNVGEIKYQSNLVLGHKSYSEESHDAYNVKFSNPGLDMKIGVVLGDMFDVEKDVSKFYFSDKGDEDYSGRFVSDDLRYYVTSGDQNKLILASRITQQPAIGNGYQVRIYKDDLVNPSIAYQWREVIDAVTPINGLNPVDGRGPEPGYELDARNKENKECSFEGDSITCKDFGINFCNLGLKEGDYVTFKCEDEPELEFYSISFQYEINEGVYTVFLGVEPGEDTMAFLMFEFKDGENHTITDFAVHSASIEDVEGQTTNMLTSGKTGSTYDCVVNVNGFTMTSDKVEWTGEPTITYTVTFDSDGGSAVASQAVTIRKCATEPAPPTKDGCTFKGWYAEGASDAYDFATPVTGDMTLTAKWEVAGSEDPVKPESPEEPAPVVKTGDEAGMVIVLSALAMLCAAGAVCIARKKRCE